MVFWGKDNLDSKSRTKETQSIPHLISGLENERIIALSVGDTSATFLSNQNKLFLINPILKTK